METAVSRLRIASDIPFKALYFVMDLCGILEISISENVADRRCVYELLCVQRMTARHAFVDHHC